MTMLFNPGYTVVEESRVKRGNTGERDVSAKTDVCQIRAACVSLRGDGVTIGTRLL